MAKSENLLRRAIRKENQMLFLKKQEGKKIKSYIHATLPISSPPISQTCYKGLLSKAKGSLHLHDLPHDLSAIIVLSFSHKVIEQLRTSRGLFQHLDDLDSYYLTLKFFHFIEVKDENLPPILRHLPVNKCYHAISRQ